MEDGFSSWVTVRGTEFVATIYYREHGKSYGQSLYEKSFKSWSDAEDWASNEVLDATLAEYPPLVY